ncbi:MAG: putative ABC transporter permease [Labilithrix sp.]|nr:putative ABC transporter permease [Labilithrix sp.]
MTLVGRLLLFFVVCSVGGWCFDTLLRSVRRKRWAPIRKLPFSPLYGTASFAVLFHPAFAFAPSDRLRAVVEFLYFGVLFCVFELLAGEIILFARGSRIWDYRDRYLNVRGHTDLFHFFLWGTSGLVGLRFLLRPLARLLGLEDA